MSQPPRFGNNDLLLLQFRPGSSNGKIVQNNLQTAKNGCSIILKTEDLREKNNIS